MQSTSNQSLALATEAQFIRDHYLDFRTAVLCKRFLEARELLSEFIKKYGCEHLQQQYYLYESCMAKFILSHESEEKSERTSLLGFLILHNQTEIIQFLLEKGLSLKPADATLASPLIMMLYALYIKPSQQNGDLVKIIVDFATQDQDADALLRMTDNKGCNFFDYTRGGVSRFFNEIFNKAQLKNFPLKQVDIGKEDAYCLFRRAHYNFYRHLIKGVLILDDIPPLITQRGPNCGYYAAAVVMRLWQLRSPNFTNKRYFARHRDFVEGCEIYGISSLSFSRNIALKDMGKKAKISGIGGLYNANLFKPILAETDFSVQVIKFSSKDELYNLVYKSLTNNLPVILTVDWIYNDKAKAAQIGLSSGENAHYITIIGMADHGHDQAIIFVSSKNFYSAPLSLLFQSSNNLKACNGSYIKSRYGEEWSEAKTSDDPSKSVQQYHFSFKNLDKLRNHMVLIYPKLLQEKYEALFSQKKEQAVKHFERR